MLVLNDAGVSTSGQLKCARFEPRRIDGQAEFSVEELDEIGTFTPSNVKNLYGWTKDIRGIPDLDIGKVKSYLMATQKTEFSRQELQSYRYVYLFMHCIFNFMNH